MTAKGRQKTLFVGRKKQFQARDCLKGENFKVEAKIKLLKVHAPVKKCKHGSPSVTRPTNMNQ